MRIRRKEATGSLISQNMKQEVIDMLLIYIIAFLLALCDDSDSSGHSQLCDETFYLAWAEEILDEDK